ncbi:MAG: glycerol-3-phosphate acyltransferase [Lachnospiraceae bacterium]|nr:glycerol-3-phosphate acyltransferase [Lachnospiraceae bacterium]
MKIMLCIIIGYLLGCLSPAAYLSRVKQTNLRENGTGNLGATNTMLVMGKGFGIMVALIDIAKAFVAVKVGALLAPATACAGILAGFAAIVGHIFPFYMHFKGGKGLATFGGLLLGVDAKLFVFLLVVAIIAMLVVNYSVAAPMSAAVLFPILYHRTHTDPYSMMIAVAVSALIIVVHLSNITRAREGNEMKIRDYLTGRGGKHAE